MTSPPLSDAELADRYPWLTVEQRREQERYWRAHHEALMFGQEPPAGPPWPEGVPDA
jgi:hypothetical protein